VKIYFSGLLLLVSSLCFADGWTSIRGTSRGGGEVYVDRYEAPEGVPYRPGDERRFEISIYSAEQARARKGKKTTLSRKAQMPRGIDDQMCHLKYPEGKKEGYFECDSKEGSPLSSTIYRIERNPTDDLNDYEYLFTCIASCNGSVETPKTMTKNWWETSEPFCDRPATIFASTKAKVRLREKPSIQALTMKLIPESTKVKIEAKNGVCRRYLDDEKGIVDGNWVKVSLAIDGKALVGWVFDGYLQYNNEASTNR
jgi:hypothetical protein